MKDIIDYLSQNKRPIVRALYFAAFLIDQLPDPDLPKEIFGRTLPVRRSFNEGRTIADQLKAKPKKRRNGKRSAHK